MHIVTNKHAKNRTITTPVKDKLETITGDAWSVL